MRTLFATLAALLTLAAFAACKRELPPSAARAPRPASTSAAIPKKKDLDKLRAQFYEIPDLGTGINYTDPKDPEHEIWTQYSNGLMIRDIKPTDGTVPKLGQTVSVAYVGRLYPGGQQFDKRTADNPLTFALGSKSMIKGFSLGVATMKTGAKRLVFIPSYLGYGSTGSAAGGILPNQDLVFEVELLTIAGEPVSLDPDFEMPQPLGPNLPATTSAPATH